LKLSFKKRVSNEGHQNKINESEITSNINYNLEKQILREFDKDKDQKWKNSTTDRQNEVIEEKVFVMENSTLKNNDKETPTISSQSDKDNSSSIEQYYCTFCNEKLENEWKKPNWRWNLDKNIKICVNCYNSKEKEFQRTLNFCKMCNLKLKFIRYNPKPEWKIKGQLCRKCWDKQNDDYKNKQKNSDYN
jgi:hypothetical protein